MSPAARRAVLSWTPSIRMAEKFFFRGGFLEFMLVQLPTLPVRDPERTRTNNLYGFTE
ncbi:hypothetical protein [Streptomyces sp. TP-A0356]|uniref:hypothetical protein n=1 Tax=Streptomyces sp. TP-A0356 TaxID=1359208 RepID=UPI001F393E83|nr:hypothetical protein [Streptomyces sp. TP-A0356]